MPAVRTTKSTPAVAVAPPVVGPAVASAPVAQRIYFVSLGCPKNQVDTELMLGQVAGAGHQLVHSPDEADVIVVNTCAFIDAAKEESVDTILEMAEFKKSKTASASRLVVTGCLAQRYSAELAKDIPEIDDIIGSADYQALSGALATVRPAPSKTPGGRIRRALPMITVSATPTYIHDHDAPRVLIGQTYSAYVKIAEGCDRPCSFCIIPKLRGPQRSRSIEDVVAEARMLAANGTVEINLIAQDLTRYGWDLSPRPTLAMLLRALGKVDGIRWIRLHYTFPSAFDDDLIDTIASEPKVAKYIDVPLQHISDKMLKRMRRGHSSRVTRELVAKLRERVEGVVIRSTFIVGHPGETQTEFDELCDFVQAAQLDRAGAFPYSIEPGTVSAILPHRVPPAVAQERQQILMEIQRKISLAKHEAMVGREIDVLVSGVSPESEFVLEGRWYGQAPSIDGTTYLTDGTAKVGTIVRARVTQGTDYDIAASLDI